MSERTIVISTPSENEPPAPAPALAQQPQPQPQPQAGRIRKVINWISDRFRRKPPATLSAAPAPVAKQKSFSDFPHHTDTDNGPSSSGDEHEHESESEHESDASEQQPRHVLHESLTQTNPDTRRVRIAKKPKDRGAERMTYKKVASIISESYNNEQTISSTALDMLSVYLKGQKILYVEAKTICEQRLNFLMLPAIMISAASAVLSLVETTGIIVASLSALNSCILSLISYLKLDARVEAHKTSAYKFDKLQALCEFNSGKVLFFDTKKDDIAGILMKIEAQVHEIKETNQFVLPEIIRRRFPILYSTNVFTLVKKLVNKEIVLMNRLKNAINAIMVCRDRHKDELDKPVVQAELDILDAEQNAALEKLIRFRDEYLDIDTMFKDEIDMHSMVRPWYRRLCDCLKN